MIKTCEVAIIGAGHAGCEAALAAAKLGANTILFTLNMDAVANMPCNPSIGGTAKGHLVRELDALGGVMGKVADETFLQSRMLNRGKGPAVHSLRVQSDRVRYQRRMKQLLEQQEGLSLVQDEVIGVTLQNGKLTHLTTKLGITYEVGASVICVGTFHQAVIHLGTASYPSGPDHLLPASGLLQDLATHGLTIRRFKTGTPPRVHRRSIDFSLLEEQLGDNPVVPFSFETIQQMEAGLLPPLVNQVTCHIAYTNEATHQLIRESLADSPLYGDQIRISGAGPRYCPSIEDKVVRFADKNRHQLFVEPMGLDTEELYLQGMSSSLPPGVQEGLLRTITGFSAVEIVRYGYAIEYDCFDPTELTAALAIKQMAGLYSAGQVNGTSGYEEAAAQGLLAGINAARYVAGQPPLVLDRASSYLGTLVDDIVTKGCSDPYRMLTSRSEYRLWLRQDNADLRLTPTGYEVGLISKERYERFCRKQEQIEREIQRLKATTLPPNDTLNALLLQRGTSPMQHGMKLAELLRRPQLGYADLTPFDPQPSDLSPFVAEQVEIAIKYEGYLHKQAHQIAQMRKLEEQRLPADLDYHALTGLRLEAREKLSKQRPENIGQASRISGVTPADIAILLLWTKEGAAES